MSPAHQTSSSRGEQSYDLLIITGATATGKTAAAVEMGHRMGSEVISADSMQVYRHLSIGTAKPTGHELRGIPYHLVDHVEPFEQYNLGRFLQEAEPLVHSLMSKKRMPIVCGGTGLYLRGLLQGVFEAAAKDEAVRAELERRLLQEGLAALHAELLRVDPGATHITPNDRQRILRALEVYYVSGKPISELQTQNAAMPRYRALVVVLTLPRALLHDRINMRADKMLNLGLLDEVRAYIEAGYSENNPAVKALGYAELIQHVRGTLSLDEAMEAMKRKSRQYAKRQETWFRSMRGAHWIDVAELPAHAVADEIEKLLLDDPGHHDSP